MTIVRVLVADDQPNVRDAIVGLLSADAELEVVGVASDAKEAVEMARSTQPDVVLLDVRMPGGGGPLAAREIREVLPAARILALSAHGEREVVLEMLRAGAVGYLVKGGPPDEIVEAVRRAGRGQSSLSMEITADVVQELAKHLKERAVESEEREHETARVRAALDDKRVLGIVFQPIVDLVTGRVVGIEALSRFDAQPPRGPDVWFKKAWSVGLGPQLELRAVQLAVERVGELEEPAYLAVNLSPETILHPDFAEALPGLPMDRLMIEITEHAPVEDYELLSAALRPIRRGGGRLAVDDAGAGFASLRHILRLGPDIIKLDLSITQRIDKDRRQRALASAFISFANEISAGIVAEGIETTEELSELRSLGVSYGQGYLLERPSPNMPEPFVKLPSD